MLLKRNPIDGHLVLGSRSMKPDMAIPVATVIANESTPPAMGMRTLQEPEPEPCVCVCVCVQNTQQIAMRKGPE